MSVSTSAWVSCNHLDNEKPSGQRACQETVTDGTDGHGPRTPGLPDDAWLWTKRDARREARKLGWAAGVHTDGTRGGQFDFCPAHKPARPRGTDGAL